MTTSGAPHPKLQPLDAPSCRACDPHHDTKSG
jgi:hypothetical protein